MIVNRPIWKNQMIEAQRTARNLDAELKALENRLDKRNMLVRALRKQLKSLQLKTGKERRINIYQRAVKDMVTEDLQNEIPPVPSGGTEELVNVLVTLGKRLDHKFAEINALSEITGRINSGVFLDEVLDHVFETFEKIIPYHRIGLAFIEFNKGGKQNVISHWVRSKDKELFIPIGYSAPLEGSSLQEIARNNTPRIINDLIVHLRNHPNSESTTLILREGIRSSLTCPLVIDDNVIGFIFFSSRHLNTYREAHVEIFLQIAGELAITVEKGRAYQEIYVRNQFIRKVFGQYVADEIVEIILNEEDALVLGGARCLVTILMCDLRRFTQMSENLSPEKVVETLNTFLGAMTAVIMKYGGTVDNFIGDSILAVFGVPVGKPNDVARAVACAVEMQNTMTSVNANNLEIGLPELAMGVGLNTGEVVVGNIGSEIRMHYSVIGSPVNVVARIESYTRGGQILASETTVKAVEDIIRTVGYSTVKVKGLSHPIPIYNISGIGGEFEVDLESGSMAIHSQGA